MNHIIEVVELSKQYRLGMRSRHDNVRESLTSGLKNGWNWLRRRKDQDRASNEAKWLWALKNINFNVESGDVLGIVGANGAGKSTLLKILSRITDPTQGLVRLRGRIASLLEVGTGFHPELTGRENVFLNGAMLGMSRAEIQSKFDDIVAFAELERFLDTPVKRYSSGMFVRLGFAVAAHLDPEILVVDEVLAVGDMAFQKRCLGKMSEFGQKGRTVIFVSHSMAAVESLCRKGLVLNKGRLVFAGTAKEAVDHYTRKLVGAGISAAHQIDLRSAAGRHDQYEQWLTKLEMYKSDGQPFSGILPTGEDLTFHVQFDLHRPTSDFDVRINFMDLRGQVIFAARSSCDSNRSTEERVGPQEYVCTIPSLTLLPGEYRLDVALVIHMYCVDYVEDATRLTMVESDFYGTGNLPHGFVVMKHSWNLRTAPRDVLAPHS